MKLHNTGKLELQQTLLPQLWNQGTFLQLKWPEVGPSVFPIQQALISAPFGPVLQHWVDCLGQRLYSDEIFIWLIDSYFHNAATLCAMLKMSAHLDQMVRCVNWNPSQWQMAFRFFHCSFMKWSKMANNVILFENTLPVLSSERKREFSLASLHL